MCLHIIKLFVESVQIHMKETCSSQHHENFPLSSFYWLGEMQPGGAAMITVAEIVSPSAAVCICAPVSLECVWYAVVPYWRQI